MNVLLDTNIVLDALAAREPFRAHAESIFELIKDKRITAFLTANSITDIYYIIRKNRDESEAREAMRILLATFSIIDIRGRDCLDALDFPIDDYEDAILLVCGMRSHADCIVTRDRHLLEIPGQDTQVLSPESFLTKMSRK
ncbi:MAG: PIN domain-containing protein [Planctomycetaceae bacterium]|nr:PIN domain-containing protein [Planctomycetaceae bacterium]